MAIGRISGSVLKSNLTRNGTDLAFETNLLYLDVTNSRVGIGTSEPSSTLTVSGNLTTTTLTATSIAGGTATDNIKFNDSIELRLGTDADANIKHTGTNLNINETTGDINIRTYADNSDVIIGSDDGSGGLANYLKADGSTGELKLYYYGSEKLKTITSGVQTTGTINVNGAYTLPTADGSNGQVLQTDGSGALTFAESSGGGGGNNTAVKQFNYYKLNQTSAVIDEFDIKEYRGAIYDVGVEDKDNNFTGHYKVSIVHDDSTPYISVYNVNEDSTRIVDFTAAISGDSVQLSAETNTSSHTNLRVYRIALGDHHETVANTNSKIIATSTSISSSATTLDQFTKTDIRGAKYVILIKDDTAGDYQISELSLTHDGTTVFHDQYALVSSRSTPLHSFSAAISGATVTLSSASGGNTTGTAILYRQDLGTKTKLGEFDNFHYGIKKDIDSAVETVDSFDVFKYKSARYFVTMESGSEYQNSEITMTINDAGTDATVSESFVITANNTLATFTADVSNGKARLRASCNPNTKIFFARLGMEAINIYRANGQTSDDLYITHNNLKLEPGALTLPTGTTANRPTASKVGMIRYNTSTDTYERYDTSGWTNIATQASVSEASGTSTGEKTSISTSAINVDTFDTSSFDSAFYLMVTRDEINDEIATQTVSLVHNDTAAFTSTGGIVRSGSNTQVAFDADISGSTVRLRGTGTADVNSVKFFRIGLGDNTSASSSGNTATIVNSDVDSAVENLDTWSASSYRGAKYYISANNSGKTELTNIECLVVHNGTDAFITMYNDHFTGNNSLLTLTADIDSGSVRLRASGNEPNTAVKMYRVLLSDSESSASSDNTKTVGQVSVSSSATAIDTFTTDNANGAHYVIVGNSSSESAASISEVFVVTDGTDAYVTTAPQVSSKGSDQLTFTAALSGTTVTLSAASTSGASTTVNGYRVQLLRNQGGASTSLQVLTSNNQTIAGQKTFTAGVLTDTIQSPGSNANITLDPQGTGAVAVLGSQTITNTTTDDSLTITTTEDSNSAGPVISLKRNSSSVADADYLGQIKFKGENDNDQEVNYAKISGKILDASDSSEDGILEFAFMKNGSQNISGRFRSDSLQLLNDTSLRVTGHVELGVLSGDPSGTSNIAHIYAKDDSASAEVYVRDEAGNVTKISPHNEKGEWEYFSRNTKTGKTVRVNMEEMIRDIEKLTGKSYIKDE